VPDDVPDDVTVDAGVDAGNAGAQVHPGLSRMVQWMLVGAALVGFLSLGTLEAWHDSATYDEPVYVSSGVIAILHHDVADNAEHPPLFKVLAALPVLFEHPVVPTDGHWNVNNERIYSARFVQAQLRAGTMHGVTFASRLVPLAECAAVALLLYALARRLFGGWAGVLAALAWLLDPVVLGLGHLNGVDLPFALTSVAVALALVRWLEQRDRRSLLWLGLACGTAVSAQTTGLLLGALAVIVIVGATARQGGWAPWRRAGLVVVVAWAFTWAVYLVLDPAVLVHSTPLLPQPYVQGLQFLGSHDTGPAPGFLAGLSWTGINVFFWPLTLLVKLPAPIVLLFVAGPLMWWRLVRHGRVGRDTTRHTVVAVVIPALILFLFELPNPRTLGVRYLLPSIALWCAMVAPLATVITRRAVAAVVGAVTVSAAAIAGGSYPNSLAYTAPPFQPGYRTATDSNIDWGQDFGLLSNWARGHPAYMAYFGPRGITTADLPGARPLVGVAPDKIHGWVAASASDLTSADRSSLSWLRAYCPVGNLGGTILLYRFTSPPTAVPGPATPAAQCSGSVSHR
jgi:hypothetical protein